MSVIKPNRKITQYEPYVKAIHIRSEIAKLMIRDFGYKPKPVSDRYKTGKLKSPKQYEADVKKRQKENEYFLWFCENERDYVTELFRDLSFYIQMAVAIEPDTPFVCEQKQSYWNKVIGTINAIIDELQFIITTLPVDVNKYISYSDELWELLGEFEKEKINNRMTYRRLRGGWDFSVDVPC